jgi:hypothetical protein
LLLLELRLLRSRRSTPLPAAAAAVGVVQRRALRLDLRLLLRMLLLLSYPVVAAAAQRSGRIPR